jgi:hypothetical protein
MKRMLSLGAAAGLALATSLAAPQAATASGVRSATLQSTEQVGAFAVQYSGAALHVDGVLLAAECSIAVQPASGEVPRYANARCAVRDVHTGESWVVQPMVSGVVVAVSAWRWSADPGLGVEVLVRPGDRPLDAAGDFELCLSAEIGTDGGPVLGPERCAAIVDA